MSKYKQHIKFSVRVNGRVTSITLKKNTIALWFMFSPFRNNEDDILSYVNDFIVDCSDDWDKDDGKGLSEHVTERMIETLLEKDDIRSYQRLVASLDSL